MSQQLEEWDEDAGWKVYLRHLAREDQDHTPQPIRFLEAVVVQASAALRDGGDARPPSVVEMETLLKAVELLEQATEADAIDFCDAIEMDDGSRGRVASDDEMLFVATVPHCLIAHPEIRRAFEDNLGVLAEDEEAGQDRFGGYVEAVFLLIERAREVLGEPSFDATEEP